MICVMCVIGMISGKTNLDVRANLMKIKVQTIII